MKYIKTVTVLVLTLILIFPLYWMAIGSFKTLTGIFHTPPDFLLRTPTLKNWATILGAPFLTVWTLNTLGIVAATLILCTALTISAAYAFTFSRLRFKRVLFWIYMATIMFPRSAMTIPMFVTIRLLGLSGTRMAMVLPLIFSPILIFFAVGYMRTIPLAFIDSARIDGAKERRILMSIIMPMCRPVIAVIAVTKTIEAFQDYLWGMLVLTRDARKTLIVGIVETTLRNRIYQMENPIGLSLAGGMILFIPMFILFCIFQRQIVGGLKIGGIKE